MINPYEIVSRSALPALRAMITRRLREKYHMTQQQIAMKLGVTQASISNYTRKARGAMINLEMDTTVSKAVDKIADILASEKADPREALRTMTEICDYIRFYHLMCNLHQDLEPSFKVEGCDACDGILTGKEFQRLKALVGQ